MKEGAPLFVDQGRRKRVAALVRIMAQQDRLAIGKLEEIVRKLDRG
jgi:hypothetical protein